MKYIIDPYQGVSPVRLLMSRQEVAAAMVVKPKQFKKTTSSKMDTDDYGVFHVFYDESDKVEAIEFFNDGITLSLNDKDLFGLDFEVLRSDLEKEDKGLEIECDTMISPKYGIAAYSPEVISGKKRKIECITVYKQGYYN